MRWICSLFLYLSCVSCTDGDTRARDLRELAELEKALTAVSTAPAEERSARLDDVEQLELKGPRTAKVRARCVEGYRAFIDATDKMAAARHHVRRIDDEVKKALSGPVDLDASAGELADLHARAVVATENLDSALAKAEELVGDCTRLRAALATEIGTE